MSPFLLLNRGPITDYNVSVTFRPFQAFTMMPSYDFTGDGVTILGFIGILSTAVILVTVFRRFVNSPLNK
jgi:hypothetical protein